MSGHLDCMDRSNWIDDFKFGAKGGAYQAQGGGYLWLAYKVLPDFNPRGFRLFEARRTKERIVPVKKTEYFFDGCINAAEIIINRLGRAAYEYEDTGDINVFAPNANSKYCTDGTCGAFGTSQCDQWIKDLSEENSKWVA